MSEETRHKVVIVGGGFGGVFTTKHLRRRTGGDVHIELISRNNFFIFQPLLPEIAGGNIHPADAASPLRLFLPGFLSALPKSGRSTWLRRRST